MRSKIVWIVNGLLLLLWLFTLPVTADQVADASHTDNRYAAGTATPTPAISCTTNSNQLNLRAGPATTYRSLRKLERNTRVNAYEVNPDRTWVHVRVQSNNQAGWVSQQYLRCPAGGLATLPTVADPPTPTPKPYAGGYTDPCIRQNCGSPGDFVGEIRIPTQVLLSATSTPVFGQRVIFELVVRPGENAPNDATVQIVEFSVINQRTGNEVYYHAEGSAPFCVFGNNSNVCDIAWDVNTSGGVWPASDANHPVTETRLDTDPETVYQANISVTGNFTNTDGIPANGFWFFQFTIVPTNATSPTAVAPTPASDFTGQWYTNFAEVTLQQNGRRVSGSYQRYGQNEAVALTGTISGRTLTGNFGNDPADQVTFTLDADGNYFDGAWLYQADGQWRQWCGVRVGLGALPAGCGFSGDWFTISDYTPASPPVANLQQVGPQVTGTFFNGADTGTITGELGTAGLVPHHSLSGVYSINGSRGVFRWDLLDFNSTQFVGCWANEEEAHEWCGWRAGEEKPAQCLPTTTPCP